MEYFKPVFLLVLGPVSVNNQTVCLFKRYCINGSEVREY